MALDIAVKRALDIWTGSETPFFTFFLPLLVISWFAGLGPGISSAILVAVAAQYIPLGHDFSLASSPLAASRLEVFLLEAAVLCWFAASQNTATKRLRKAEQLYHTLADNIPQLVWISRSDGGIAYMNPRTCAYTGLLPEQLLEWEWKSVVHPDDYASTVEGWKEALQMGRQYETRYRLRGADGSYRWFLGRAVPMRDGRNRITNWFGTATDIDDEVRAEETHARLAAIVESASEAIVGGTPDGIVVSWNAAAEKIFGYSAAEIIGKSVSLLFPADHVDDLRLANEKLARNERVYRQEIVQIRKDGSRIVVSVNLSPITNPLGRVIGVSAIARDITERKRAEEALRESEARFRLVADSAPVMIWMGDPGGERTYCNKTYLIFTGRREENEQGKRWLEAVHPQDQEFCLATFQSALDARKPYEMEYRIRRADGQFRWVTESGVPRFGAGDLFEGYVGSCVDITERKWVEQALRGAFDELETEVEQRGQALAEASERLRHEITKRIEAEAALHGVKNLS